jgi:hypothetical protein
MESIYWIDGPTQWVEPPSVFSYSSLTQIERCPLKWQLIHSSYGSYRHFPARLNPAAVEGDIVHRSLDQLFKSFTLCGLPEIGTTKFKEFVKEFNLYRFVLESVEEYNDFISRHPRSTGFRLSSNIQQLVNKIIRFFRAEYPQICATHKGALPIKRAKRAYTESESQIGTKLLSSLKKQGSLSEVSIMDEQLRFQGIIDFLWSDAKGTIIADFKTGKPHSEHRKQIIYYAVLWWRYTGDKPFRIEVRYYNSVDPLHVDEESLKQAEQDLNKSIKSSISVLSKMPAEARIGDHCRYCDVRQFCELYWESTIDPKKSRENTTSVDMEVRINDDPSANGFEGKGKNGKNYSIVFRQELEKIHGPFFKGDRIRLLRGVNPEHSSEIELKTWTEVFHVSESSEKTEHF